MSGSNSTNTDDWKKHRRAVYAQTGSTFHRIIISTLIGSHACMTWYYLNTYRKNDLPQFQINALTACHVIYSVRSILSWNVFLKYRNYTKAACVVLGCVILPLFTFPAALTAKALKHNDVKAKIGIVLYALGSIIHTLSEFQRWMFKSNEKNKGKLFTKGLAALSRNPNFLGDALLYEGWYLLSNNYYNQAIPILIAGNLVLKNIPDKEKYLKSKYKSEWSSYQENVKSFIPFIL